MSTCLLAVTGTCGTWCAPLIACSGTESTNTREKDSHGGASESGSNFWTHCLARFGGFELEKTWDACFWGIMHQRVYKAIHKKIWRIDGGTCSHIVWTICSQDLFLIIQLYQSCTLDHFYEKEIAFQGPFHVVTLGELPVCSLTSYTWAAHSDISDLSNEP